MTPSPEGERGPRPEPLVRAVDASVLIVPANVGRLDLLTLDGRAALIAETVFQEVLAGQEGDPARRALLGGFGTRTPDLPPPSALASYTTGTALDAGEAATLALALTRGLPAVLDDGAGRRAARALGIPHTGTAGVILEGKRRGALTSAADLLHQAEQAGWFSPPDGLLRAELALLGEAWP